MILTFAMVDQEIGRESSQMEGAPAPLRFRLHKNEPASSLSLKSAIFTRYSFCFAHKTVLVAHVAFLLFVFDIAALVTFAFVTRQGLDVGVAK